uniref:Uncharacterized protein n=1 Tax=Octopus bimaculoides TaxID=37653 RepID=A0A0L8G4T6_OCTBM
MAHTVHHWTSKYMLLSGSRRRCCMTGKTDLWIVHSFMDNSICATGILDQ